MTSPRLKGDRRGATTRQSCAGWRTSSRARRFPSCPSPAASVTLSQTVHHNRSLDADFAWLAVRHRVILGIEELDEQPRHRTARILVEHVYQQAHRIERSANGILLRIHRKASSCS
jgi:hypothetical protein